MPIQQTLSNHDIIRLKYDSQYIYLFLHICIIISIKYSNVIIITYFILQTIESIFISHLVIFQIHRLQIVQYTVISISHTQNYCSSLKRSNFIKRKEKKRMRIKFLLPLLEESSIRHIQEVYKVFLMKNRRVIIILCIY